MRERLNPPALIAAAACFAACLAILVYDGPAKLLVRGTVGDVVVIVLIVGALAGVGLGTARSRLVGVGALALGTELLQGLGVVPDGAPTWVKVVVGSTFDPRDLLAYAVGLALAAACERAWRRPVSA